METELEPADSCLGCFKSNKKCLLLALDQADVEYDQSTLFSTEGTNALHLGTASGDFNVILFAIKCFITDPGLVTFNCVKLFVDTYDNSGFTALQLAALDGNLKCAQLLIRYGADMHTSPRNGKGNALEFARKNRNKEIVNGLNKLAQELERNGCIMEQLEAEMEVICSQSVNSPDAIQEISNLIITKNVDINFTDPNGDTPLHLACLASNEHLMMNLLFFKASTTCNRNEKSRTLLHYACKHVLSIRFFLTKKFPYLLIIRDSKGYFPMHIAAKKGDFEFLSFLFDREKYPIENQFPESTAGQDRDTQTDVEEYKHLKWNEKSGSDPQIPKIGLKKHFRKVSLQTPENPYKLGTARLARLGRRGPRQNANDLVPRRSFDDEKFMSTYLDPELISDDEFRQDLSDLSYCIKRISLVDKALDERTMLHFAVANGHMSVVELLIEVCDIHSGFSDRNCTVNDLVNLLTDIGVSPLTEALTIRRIDIIEFLLANKARFITTSCYTLAVFLEKTDSEQALQFLQNLTKEHLAEFLQVLAIEHTLHTPSTSSLLHTLMREERFTIMAFLLKNNVKFNVEALIIAFTLCIVEKRKEHLELFIQEFPHIQHKNSELSLENFLNQSNSSISFIYEAVKVKDIHIVKLLLQSGADPSLYHPQSLERNLLYIAYSHSGLDKGELFHTLLEHTISINIQEAVESVGSYANSDCITWMLVIHVISVNLQSLYIKRRMTQIDCVCDPEALVYNGSALLEDFGFHFIEPKWIVSCAYIVDKLDSIISDYRVEFSTPFPQLRDTSFYKYVIRRLKTSDKIASISIDHLKCSYIGKISFRNNKLSVIPIEIFDLPCVRNIDISDNSIKHIPERNSNLYPDETDEEKVRSKYGCKNLRSLDVSNNELNELPADLFYLSKLADLDASSNNLSAVPHELWLAENLTNLKLNKNKLNYLSKDLYSESGCSLNPRASILIRRRVETMPSTTPVESREPNREASRERSANLLDYYVISNEYASDMSSPADNSQCSTDSRYRDRGQSFRRPLALPNWTDYSTLHSLELANNNFSIFPHDLACIAPKLQRLDMRNNSLKKLNIYLDLPKFLQLILFDNNSITTLHEQLDPIPCSSPCCVAMQDSYPLPFKPTSWCSHHQYAPFPQLQTISFNKNQINDFPIALHQSKEEQYANQKLNNNKMKSLVLFPSLLALALSDNQLTEVPRDIALLTSITSINISNNPEIRHLPSSLKSLANLFSINLNGLEIEGIPDYILRGHTAQLISFLDNQAQDTKPYRSLKLFLLGDEGKGKSTLLSHLGKGKIQLYGPECEAAVLKQKHQCDPYKPTSGVETGIWDLTRPRKRELTTCFPHQIRFFCWDFAGREEYYPAYQGFLCRRAMYVVVWDVTECEIGVKGLEKWLQCIQKNVPGSSCFIVGTHLNKVQMKKNVMKDMTTQIKSIFEKSPYLYPNLLSIQFLDCFDEEKVSNLRDHIYIEATKLVEKDKIHAVAVPILEKPIPVNHIQLIKNLTYIKDQSELQKKIRVLNRHNFNKLVGQVWQGPRMPDAEFQLAVRFLHSTGYLMHFEEDPDLMDEYVINMEWLCKTFVSVLHSQIPLNEDQQLTKCGVVQKSKVRDILKDLNIHEHDMDKIIIFMRKFEILLELSDKFFIFPSLLPKVKSQATQLTVNLNLSTEQNSVPGQFIDCPQINHDNVSSISSISSVVTLNLPSFRVNEGPPKVSKLRRKSSTKPAFFQWVRLYLTQLIPSDFWARLLSRVIADQSYLTTLQNSLNNYLKTCKSADVREQVVRELTSNLHWKVWYNRLGLYVASEEILLVSFLQLPSLHFTELLMVDEPPDHAPPTKGEFSGGVYVVVREWEGIRVKSRKNSGRLSSRSAVTLDPSISIQLTTWLLQRSMYHVEEVFDEWKEKLYTVRRSMFLPVPPRLTSYIPCPECYHSISIHAESLTKEFSPPVTKKESPYSIEMDSFPAIPEETPEPKEESINELFVYSIVYLSSLARDGKELHCPKHGSIPLVYLVPDILFQDLPGPLLYSMDKVKKCKLIGEGGYGRVFRGKVVSSLTSCEQEIAVKEVHPSEDVLTHPDDLDEKHYLTYKSCSVELRVLMQLKHANILQVVGVTLSPYCILMEIAPQGDLHKIIKLYNRSKSYISSSAITMTCKQVASALAYLHFVRIVYRDLKPSNILVFIYPEPITEQNQRSEKDLLVKVADYGISSFLAPYGLKGGPGTEKYMAPEMLKKNAEQSYDKPVDVYSFGLVIYCLITLESPFSEDSIPTAKHKTLKGARPEVPTKARPRSIYLMDLMRWCWAQNPKERPTFDQIKVICTNESFERLLFACRLTRGRKNPTCACLVQSSPKPSQIPALSKQRSSTNCTTSFGKRYACTHNVETPTKIFSSSSATSLSEIQSDESLLQNGFNGTDSTQQTESDASCTQDDDDAKPSRPGRLGINLQSPIHSLSPELESPAITPIDEDVVSFRRRDATTFVKPVVSGAFTNSQLWYGTGEGNLNLFEVLEKEFRVKAALKFDRSRVNCMVSTGKYVWIGTDNLGLHIFSVKSHKKLSTWDPGQNCQPRERNILDIIYIKDYDFVVASLSSASLYVFAEASLPSVIKTPMFKIDQPRSAVCMTVATPHDKPMHIWCGCDNYVIIRYTCEVDGTLIPFEDSLTFESERPGKRPNIEHIWCFDEKNLVVCCVGCELGLCALDTGTWLKSVSCHNILTCSEYQARVTALTGYQGVLYVGTGCGAILVLDPESFTLMGKMHEYTDPIRVLIPTESNFNRLVMNPSTTRPLTRGVHFEPAASKPQSLLISLGLAFQGITRSRKNIPKTLEEVVEWNSNKDFEPTKPDIEDSYMLIFSLKGWANSGDQ